MAPCPTARKLSDDLQVILARITDVTAAQLEAFRHRREEEMMRLDRELENLMGEKERAIGAVREHRRQHGCSGADV